MIEANIPKCGGIEVTPEMVTAALDELRRWDVRDTDEIYIEIMTAVLKAAMSRVKRTPEGV